MIVKSMFGTWAVDYHSPEYIANSRRSGGWVLAETHSRKVNLPQIPQMASDQGVGFFKRRGDAKAWASEIIQISPRMTLMISCRSKAKYNSSGIEKNNILIHCHPP